MKEGQASNGSPVAVENCAAMRVWHNGNPAMDGWMDGEHTHPEGTWEKRIFDEDEVDDVPGHGHVM